jgi:hypothetical protein
MIDVTHPVNVTRSEDKLVAQWKNADKLDEENKVRSEGTG